MIDVKLGSDCLNCTIPLSEDGFNIYCGDCSENFYDIHEIQDSIEHVSLNDFEWKDKNKSHIGFKDQEELDVFLSGLKKGYMSALFWMCEYFGLNEFFTEKIQSKFKNE